MTTYVVDASVAAKWFFAEELSDVARRLIRSDVTFHAPDLLLLELAARVAAIIKSLDQRGAWVERGALRFHKVEPESGAINCQTFADNVHTLSQYLVASRGSRVTGPAVADLASRFPRIVSPQGVAPVPGGRAGPREGDRGKAGPREGDGTRTGPRDGDTGKTGPRDGDAGKTGPRDGDTGRAGPRDGEGGKTGPKDKEGGTKGDAEREG